MQYECEEILVEFCDSARPSWSRRQGADTVPHVDLWWHGSCLRELRYPQKARQHLDIYTKTLTWTLDYVYIDMAMQHARTHATYIYVHTYTITHPFATHDTYIRTHVPKFMLALFLVSPPMTKLPVVIYYVRERGRMTIYFLRLLYYTYTQGDIQVNLRVTFTWMVSLASMHIGGPWRSCFLSVLRYETYV